VSAVWAWEKVVPHLAARGCHVWVLDMNGFGWPGKPEDAKYDALTLMEEVSRWMDVMGNQEVRFAGNSLAGRCVFQRGKTMKKNLLFTIGMFLITACTPSAQAFVPAEASAPLPQGEKTWSADVDKNMKSIVNPPENIPLFSRFLLRRAEKEFGKELLPGRILTWSTDMGVGSAFLETFIERGAAKILPARLIYLLRMQVSHDVGCAFAMDVNSYKYKDYNITEDEIRALQGKIKLAETQTFSERERVALRYAIALTRTPVRFDGRLIDDIRRLFSEQEIVAISTLAAKVNYWARLIEAWRVKPAGYTSDPLLEIDTFNTRK
jgi:alkylhydroperoxidase family enzyme